MTTAAQEARDTAMATVDANADDIWKECVDLVIEVLCEERGKGVTLTTDQIWDRMEKEFPQLNTHERRAMGPVMARAARKGLIVRTNKTIESERIECHARPITIWEIL